MSEFGLRDYQAALALSPKMLAFALEARGKRKAAETLMQLQDLALASGLKLGLEYIDPSNPSGAPRAGEGYHSIKRYQQRVEELDRIARPEWYTEEAIEQRRADEEWADLEKLRATLGAVVRA